MKFSSIPAAGLAALASFATPALAQQSDWAFEGTLYLFMPETTTSIATPVRTVEGKLSFSDALANLDFAFMGAVGASNGRWSLLLDYMYNDLSFGNPGPLPGTTVNTSAKTQILNGYVAYQVYEDPTVRLDLAAGFRWFDAKTSLTLLPSPPFGTNRIDENWVDPVVGVRARFRFSDRWSGTAFFDYGGFTGGDETWQALLTADYAINDRWLVRGGYRYITMDHDIAAGNFSFTQSGPILGVTYRF